MNELVEAEKALGVVLRGIELFGKEKTFLPCQRLFLNSLLWRDSVHFLQERGYVVIENRRGTFVAPPYKTLQGLQKSLEDKFNLNSNTCPLPDIRPNYPLRVPHFSGEKQKLRTLSKSSLKTTHNDGSIKVSSKSVDASDFSVNEYLNKKRKLEDLYNKPADTIVVSSPGMEIDAVSNETSNSSSEEECETSSVDEDDYIFKEQESMKNIEYALVFQNEDICSMVELSCVNVLANFCKQRSNNNATVEDMFVSEDISKKKPKRHRVTKEELDLLESIFQKTSGYPDSESFEKIANELHWDVNKVKKWFQNQRQRQKEKRPKLEESSKNTVTWWPSGTTEWREIPHDIIQPQPVIV